nr:hypothetical protein [uncultured Phascolarctobacterium sp.]
MAALFFYQLPEYLRNDAVFRESFLFGQQGKFGVQLLRDSNGQFLLCRHFLVTTFADIILRRHLAVNNTLANYFVLFYYQKGVAICRHNYLNLLSALIALPWKSCAISLMVISEP